MGEAAGWKETLILVTGEGMGHGDPGLRARLFAKYLELLEENGRVPGAMAFYADGVKLAVEGSPVLDRLRSLEARGARLVLCRTCLDFHGVADRIRVGIVGGMGDILAAQELAAKVITL